MARPPRNGKDSHGNAKYDLSGDKKAALQGDEDAELRVRTKRRLDLASLAENSRQQ